MAFYVYMLKSKGAKSVTYVGYTKNLKKRIAQHNSSKGAKFTKGVNGNLFIRKNLIQKVRQFLENII